MSEMKMTPAYTNGRCALVTEYRGPTDRSGSRILVRMYGRRTRSIPYPRECGMTDAHIRAAAEVGASLGMKGPLIGSVLPNGKGYVFVER